MSHVSNAFGIITPLKEISDLARQYNCTMVVDAAQSAGLLDINLRELDIDFSFSGHKTLYGPLELQASYAIMINKLNPIIWWNGKRFNKYGRAIKYTR